LKSLRQTKWYECASRFALVGAINVIAALLANKFGPVVGGRFLAFPAIFPASATLVEKHEIEKRLRKQCTARSVDAMLQLSMPRVQYWEVLDSSCLFCSCGSCCRITHPG